MRLPWAFLFIAAGIVLIAGDGWFPGQTLVGILALVWGTVGSLFKWLLVALIAGLAADRKRPPRIL
jgi:hypothetical protein